MSQTKQSYNFLYSDNSPIINTEKYLLCPSSNSSDSNECLCEKMLVSAIVYALFAYFPPCKHNKTDMLKVMTNSTQRDNILKASSNISMVYNYSYALKAKKYMEAYNLFPKVTKEKAIASIYAYNINCVI